MTGDSDAGGQGRRLVRRKPWDAPEVTQKPGAISAERLFTQSVISPLRYPGAKRRLVPIIEAIIEGNIPPPRLLVEPFCGGASTALRLVGTGVVQHAILADYDPLVSAFWYSAAFDTKWLVDHMMDEPITVDQWKRWKQATPNGRRDKALKCLFLNRTTFSGILHGRAGPIGGKNQDENTKYKIDCRFNKEALAERINAIGELADTGRILDVWTHDWRQTLLRVQSEYGDGEKLTRDDILVYLDPPYVEKAPYLYKLSFNEKEHSALAHTLSDAHSYRWILSYDDDDLIRKLYPVGPERHVLHARHQYSVAALKASDNKKRQRVVRDEVLVTNFVDIPESDKFHTFGYSGCASCRDLGLQAED